MRLRAWLLIAALVGLPQARVASAAPDPTALAQEQFRQGRDALKRGDYAGALELFRKSQELLPTAGTLLNLASCEEKLGLLASARQHFQQALAGLPDSDAGRVRLAKQSLAALEPRVPRLQIKLAKSAAQGARVMLDDAVVAPASLETDLPVNPGKHAIVVSASNLPDRHYEVTLEEGKATSITVETGIRESQPAPAPPAPAAAPPPPPPPVAPPSTSGTRIAGFVLGGVGLAGLGAGAVTGVMALSTKRQLEKDCPDPTMCDQAGVDKAATGKTLSLVSTASLIAGGAFVGVGLVLVIAGGNADRPAAAVGVSPLPGGGAFSVAGSF